MNVTPEQLKQNYAFVHIQDIDWAHMDIHGHVNNTLYYHYMENARLAYFNNLNFLKFTKDFNVIIRKTDCEYFYPVKYPDKLHIAVKVTKMGNTSLTMEYVLVSELTNKVAAKGSVVMILMEKDMSNKYPIPDEVRNAITDFDKL